MNGHDLYNQTMSNVTVVGLGKIGLPLAVAIAKSGQNVIGVDINLDLISNINAGKVPIGFSEPSLDEFLRHVINGGFLIATDNLEKAVKNSDTIVVIVPLFITEKNDPNFRTLDEVTEIIGNNLISGTTVIYETTLPVGTTRNRFLPALLKASGLSDSDFQLAFSPERVFVGDFFRTLQNIPKIVGGINRASTNSASDFYRSFINFASTDFNGRENGVWEFDGAESAEFAKLAETTYRDVNIALANTFATHALDLDIDINEIIAACNSQPFSHIHNPGIYVGGHCIPVYPHLYTQSHSGAQLIHLSRTINEDMPATLLNSIDISTYLKKNSNVTVMGVSYREGVKETYHSGIFKLCELLENYGANVSVYDPKYSDKELVELGFTSFIPEFNPGVLIFQNAEDSFRHMTKEMFPSVTLVVDGRGFIDSQNWPGVPIKGFGISTNKNAPNTSIL